MPDLPASSAFTGSAITEAQFKTAITDLREFLAGLLGTAGTQAAALTALGSMISGASTKTASHTVVAGDRGALLVFNVNFVGWTYVNMTAAATLGAGFAIAIRNDGPAGSTISINPAGSELIDGALSRELEPGDNCLVICTGSGWVTVGRGSKFKAVRQRNLTAGTTYTRPSDVVSILVLVIGSTGGVASSGNISKGGVGGGGYSQKFYATPAASYSYACGAAGTTSGTAGGTTTFGVMSVTGSGGVTSITGSAGGVGSGGDFNAIGGSGGNSPSLYCGGGGGGAGGGRTGSGYSGGNGDSTQYGHGGGGGGSGSSGAAATNTVAGAGGVAKTTLGTTAISGLDDTTYSFATSAGQSGTYGDLSSYGGSGGAGASCNELISAYGATFIAGGQGGYGGAGVNIGGYAGKQGYISIMEFSA